MACGRSLPIVALFLLAGACIAPAAAQELFGAGRLATPEEVREVDVTVGPEGKPRCSSFETASSKRRT